MGTSRCELMDWQSLELVRGHTIGRLCIIDQGHPIAVPVNYSVSNGGADDLRFFVRTAPGTMLGRYDGPASIEVDDIDLENGSAWSVIARGALHRTIDTDHLPDPAPLISEGRDRWLTMTAFAISGRRFTVSAAADGFSVDWQLAPT